MSGPRILMLVSCRVDRRLRDAVEARERPCPEFLRLERDHGVHLLDWSALTGSVRRRSVRSSVVHARAAISRLDGHDVVFSDGEHVGLPLALALRARGRRFPHLMLGHHLTTRIKPRLVRMTTEAVLTRVLVHSRRQMSAVEHSMGLTGRRLAWVPYFADAAFWSPRSGDDAPLIVSAGLEHRDYTTLAAACESLPVDVVIAAGSLHSPDAVCASPGRLPANVSRRFHGYRELRDLYAGARIVVVPLLPNDFQGGVTTLLEAMSMGRAVVVSATDGLRDLVRDGETGMLVTPGDAGELRGAIRHLLSAPDERARLGANARSAVEAEFSLDHYSARLMSHLHEVGGRAGVAV